MRAAVLFFAGAGLGVLFFGVLVMVLGSVAMAVG